MDIRNVTQFASFISANGFQQLDGILRQAVDCLTGYSAACNCYKVEDKQRMYAACNKLYMDAVRHVIPRFKNVILAKIPDRQITFYSENGTLITIVSR